MYREAFCVCRMGAKCRCRKRKKGQVLPDRLNGIVEKMVSTETVQNQNRRGIEEKSGHKL